MATQQMTLEQLEKTYKSQAVSLREVNEDRQRLSRLNRYIHSTHTPKERVLLLNQLIIVFNTFKFAWACVLMEVSARDTRTLHKLYAVMFSLGFDMSGCEIDTEFLKTFEEILDEHPKHSKILKSFSGGKWW